MYIVYLFISLDWSDLNPESVASIPKSCHNYIVVIIVMEGGRDRVTDRELRIIGLEISLGCRDGSCT